MSLQPFVVQPFAGINKTVAGLVCNTALRCSGGANPTALVQALALANATLTAVSNTTEDEDLFQTVVVITSQVEVNSQPPNRYGHTDGPVISARSMWATGIHVVSVIANDVCKYEETGESGRDRERHRDTETQSVWQQKF